MGAQGRDLQSRQAIKAQGSGLTVSWQFEAVKVSEEVTELRAAGVPLLRLRGEGAEATVQRLAAQLNDARWRGISPDMLQVVWIKGGYQLQLQGEPLLTVTHALAQQMGSEPKALAQQWAQRLRQALSWQWLAVPLTEAVIAVGEELTIPLLGNAVGDVQVQARPAEPLRWRVGVEKQAVFVTLKGMDVGCGQNLPSRPQLKLHRHEDSVLNGFPNHPSAHLLTPHPCDRRLTPPSSTVKDTEGQPHPNSAFHDAQDASTDIHAF